MTHHPSCPVRVMASVYDVPVSLIESELRPCGCQLAIEHKRTLAGDLEHLKRELAEAGHVLKGKLVELAWYATRENFLLGLAALAIAGLFAGLLIGWWT